MKTKLLIAAVAGSLLFTACGAGEPDPDAEFCEHLQEGPASAVTAATMSPPAIAADHTRYDVTLTDVTGGKGGQVTFAADEATDFIFAFNKDVPVAFKKSDGTAITPEETVKTSTGCTDIAAKYTVPLEVGTVTLDFGPTTETQVGIVVEEGAHEVH